MAARDLSASEIIIKQSPLVIGPIANDENAPVCLNCYQALEIDESFRYEHQHSCQYLSLLYDLTFRFCFIIFPSMPTCKTPDVQSAAFLSAPHSAITEITQRLSVAFSRLTISINICIGKRTEPSCRATTKQLPS